jgi:aryl-alcohol dehydrogenase-like predicted oxidoreductase
MQRTPLGSTGISISPLGVGTWQWGSRVVWGYGTGEYSDADLAAGFRESLQAGLNLFDTAEAYGSGRSEVLLGTFVRAAGQPVVVASKFMPFPWRLSRKSLRRALRRSLERLGLARVDLYQMHFPTPPIPIETWVDALADAVQEGLVRAAGVCNYSTAQMLRAHEVLARRGVPLAAVQVRYSLLARQPETTGLLAACRDRQITLIAYSPLAQGILTGKYTPQNPPPGVRGLIHGRVLERVRSLTALLREIGQGHGGKTPAQVALNWLLCKGAVPIPGAKNAHQARENAAALGWHLTEQEVAVLDEASAQRQL